jgi:hypothetical protein
LANDDEAGAEPKGESAPAGVVGDLTTMSGGGGGEGDLRNLCGRRLSLKDELGEPGESEAEGMAWTAREGERVDGLAADEARADRAWRDAVSEVSQGRRGGVGSGAGWPAGVRGLNVRMGRRIFTGCALASVNDVAEPRMREGQE